MVKSVSNKQGNSYRVAASHLITTCATLAAVLLFAIIGSKVVPSAIGLSSHNASTNLLLVAFLLNNAIELFGWRRALELEETQATLKQAENEAYINAYSDHTTGLPNRRALLREIDAFDQAECGGALILIDVDHFKRVNDLYGHSAGDQLLQQVGEALVRALPASAFVARLGGDEFAALVRDRNEAESSAHKILSEFAQPVKIGELRAQISLSAGIAP